MTDPGIHVGGWIVCRGGEMTVDGWMEIWVRVRGWEKGKEREIFFILHPSL